VNKPWLTRSKYCGFYVSIIVGFIGAGSATATEPFRVYWTDLGFFNASRIERSAIDGTNQEVVLSMDKQIDRYTGIDIDWVNGRVYWTFGRESIWRARLNGSQQEMLLCWPVSEASVGGIVLDVAGGKMFWADEALDSVRRANFDGTDVEDVVVIDADGGGASRIWDVDLDLSAGKVYWTDGGTHKIQRANLDGSNVEDVRSGISEARTIALDTVNGHIYFADFNIGVRRINLDDGQGLQNIVFDSPVSGVDVDVAAGKVYWTKYYVFPNFSTGKIRRGNLDGTQVEDIVPDGLRLPKHIVVIPNIVDICDFETMIECFTGPVGLVLEDGCTNSDFDRDGDVDLSDFGVLQAIFGQVAE
jgi:Low-density lipoprotein receptor repeat class B